ncbi:MAG: riboflavin synthase [Acutalibacteraceae bacterium]|nr:riboflavin synthase [Acutalibacteraceae bacterium]
MFTGIVEEIGEIKQVINGEKSSTVVINANKVLQGTQLGDSIAVNGICLTVTDITGNCFSADVMAETMRRTNLGSQNVGSKVNLERALTPFTRMGGHIVSGHIDGVGTITAYLKEDNATWVTVSADVNILKYVVEKGSIAIDGISLTVAYVDDKCFKVSIIPHTSQETTLLTKGVGSTVNLECDVIAKYVEKLMGFKDNNKTKNNEISEEMLIKYGFM